MRTPIYVLIAALVLGGCSTHYHATPAGSPRPDRIDAPPPPRIEPLELDIGRPSGGQLLLQTSRPAYVAIFEIIPNRGVTLIYPAAAHQQNMLVSGLTWVPLWWSPKRATFNSDRYIYAVASEDPLRLTGETFVTGYFHRVLGPGIYRAESPYSTMRAISRAVVPDVAEEEWAEDVYVLTPTYLSDPYRTARIYCPGGRVFDVPEDMVSRIWCPTRTRVVIVDAARPRTRDYPVSRPVRPDSVYGHGGRRVRFEPRPPRGPIRRVVDPVNRDRDNDRGRPARDNARDARDERSDESAKPEKEPRGRSIGDLIRKAKDASKEEQEREKTEREERRREAEEARRRAAEERQSERDRREAERRDERDARKEERDERKDERQADREARKDERESERGARKEERKEERRDEPKQQGKAREESRQEPKREEKREEKRDDTKGRGSIKDAIKDAKEKEKEKEKEKGKP